MTLEAAVNGYVDALMDECIKAYGAHGKKAKKRNMLPGASRERTKMHAAVVAQDRIERPNKPKSFAPKNADKAVAETEEKVWWFVRKIYRDAAKSAGIGHPATALFAVAAVAPAAGNTDTLSAESTMSRRGFVAGGIIVTAAAILAPQPALAYNESLLRRVHDFIARRLSRKEKEVRKEMIITMGIRG